MPNDEQNDPIEQSSVIPYRIVDGQLELLLITSVRKKNWIIPKGIVEPDMTPEESALMEAWEEAGIRGEIVPPAVGEYEYPKWGTTCRVLVFLMRVDEVLDEWPESGFRKRKWVRWPNAADKIENSRLRSLIEQSAAKLGGSAA